MLLRLCFWQELEAVKNPADQFSKMKFFEGC